MKVALLTRVSSDEQDYQRQIDDLSKVCKNNDWEIVKIIKGKFSATKTRTKNRIDLPILLSLVKSKSIQKVVVTEITRMGRNAKEILELYYFLKEEKISLYIHQFRMDTNGDTPMAQLMIDMFVGLMGSMAQLETTQLSERVKSGIARARKEGKQIGRRKGKEDFAKKIASNKSYRAASIYLQAGNLSQAKIAKLCDLSENTVLKINRYLKKNGK